MTCFWNGIINSLAYNDLEILDIKSKNIYNLIDSLKNKNCEYTGVKWQNNVINRHQINENIEHIKCYDKNTAGQGYLCSTCDPFLILLSYLLKIDIIHNYCGNIIKYTNNNSSKCFYYKSNSGHFWFEKTKKLIDII